MNNTQKDAGLAGLLEQIKDNLTGDQCAELGVYELERNVTALAASHEGLVRLVEQLSGPHGFSLELMTAPWCSNARTALAAARKAIDGVAK